MTHTSSVTRVLGGGMIVAPILLAAATVAYGLGGGMNRDVLGGTIQLYAMAAFGLAVVGLVGLLATRRPRLAAVLLVPAMIGVAGGVGFGVDSIHAGLPSGGKLMEIAPSAAAPSIQIAGMIFPPALAAIGIALALTRTAPRWAAATIVIGALLFPVSRVLGILPLALAADLVLVVGLGRVGFELVRGSRPGTEADRVVASRGASSPA